MESLNKVFLMGHLGADPQVQTDSKGRAYAKINLAINRSWETDNGQRENKTDWHKIYVWGKKGELCNRYLKKGAPLFVEGHMTVVESGDKESGVKKQTLITADSVKFLPFFKENESKH